MKKIEKIIKKFKKSVKKIINPTFYAKCNYIKYYNKLKVNDKYIILDSQHGKNINGNIYYILKELTSNPKYNNYKIYLVVDKQSKKGIIDLLAKRNILNFEPLVMQTKKYYKIMASAKYLINDTSFLPFFIKKEDQVYLNVWHGTPLKNMGRKVNDNYHNIGNVQKNFLIADYLLYPNEYMMEHMIDDYMLKNICDAKCLLSGYPRNTAFFDEQIKKEIRNKYDLNGKQVVAYMPTWRGNSNEVETTKQILEQIDKKLNNNQIMYVNLHPFVKNEIDYNYKHIKQFPNDYETYEFLNATDCLITDYSSVFFDYAITRNKIILFNYDEDEYFRDRGVYLKLDELIFPKTPTIDKLIAEINNKKIVDYDSFLKKYCNYDNINATTDLCEHVILNKKIEEKVIEKNNKKNVLIYTGSLAKNGITTALINLFNNLPNDNNYYLTFSSKIVKNNKTNIRKFPDYVNYISIEGNANATLFEKIILKLYLSGILKKIGLKTVQKIYYRDIKRIYGNCKFDSVIQYGGYDKNKIMLFSLFDCKKTIFVHSDMKKEIETRKNQKKHILSYAYGKYDNVAVVNTSLIKNTKYFNDSSNIVVVNNVIDYNNIIKKSKEKICFDDDTICNVSLQKLNNILNSESKKFVNVGRFSKEKGHYRMINAFNNIYLENSNVYLIIIGGHGVEYEKTINYIKCLPCKDNIIIIKSMLNPFPVVKKCDCFVLSSFYEGFGLCLVEADVLGIQSFSVDIDGPKEFILSNNGNIVENSENGIYEGMKSYLNNKLNKMNVDYETYNKKAISEFESII